MDACHDSGSNSIDLENGDDISYAIQNDINVELDSNQNENSMAANKCKDETLKSSDEEGTIHLSAPLTAEFPEKSDNSEKNEIEVNNLHVTETKDPYRGCSSIISDNSTNAMEVNVHVSQKKDNISHIERSNIISDDSLKKAVEVVNLHLTETNDVSYKETSVIAISNNIDDGSTSNACSVIIADIEDPEVLSMRSNSNSLASEESNAITTVEPLKNGYRCRDESWSEDDESSSSSSDSSSDSDTFFEALRQAPAPKATYPLMKTKGELDMEELPPIEDLIISVEEKEMEKIGKVYAIVEKLVVIRALKDMKTLDLDSVLFLSHDKPLGRVFDVFGPVAEPFYSVRFNSIEHIIEKDVKIDADVFFAPEKNEITSYVFIDDLQTQKGSDASWKHNNEPPEEFLDYSDDEQERAAKRKRVIRNRNKSFNNSSDVVAKRPSRPGDTPDQPIYIPPPRPAPQRNLHNSTTGYYRPNPYSSVPRPILSPAPPSLQRFTMVSPAPSPYGIPQHNQFHLPFSVHSPPPPLPFQQHPNMLQRHPQSPLVFATHQQPVFGQLSIMSPALHTPSPFQPAIIGSVPSLIPATHLSPVNPQNYFSQRFPRSPSPALQNGSPMSPDPWLPNRAPYHQQSNLPPNAPLTVQIPPNISSPSIPVHPFEQVNGSVQPFVNNQNVNFPPQFANHQNVHFPNGNIANHQNVHFPNGNIANHQNVHFPNGSVRPRFY